MRTATQQTTTKLCDKRYTFGVHIANFSVISSNICSELAYCVYTSQVIHGPLVVQKIVMFCDASF